MPTRPRRSTDRLWPHERESSSWSSRGLATVITVVAFVGALIAMRTVRSLRFTESRAHDAVAIVRLSPPNERIETPKPPTPTRVRAPTRPTPRVVPQVVPPGKATTDSVTGAPPGTPTGASPISSPVISPVAAPTSGVARDSSGGASSGGAMRGAPYAPAGVTAASRNLTAAQKDSIAKALIFGISAEEWHKPLTPQELADVRARREPGLDPHGRAARLPGEPVYAPLMNGGYAVAMPLVSIPLPFGKSRAQRKADSIIDADYQARLARLQQRLAQQRVVAKADSARRDSLLRVGRRP